ncbi:hypothetical protein QFC22_001581 [Naganishia vaughanmartiniae]|uniref:Uncharacterized protein n=1 Tax=Naganishia vaughanmartiniae TaxID=1424756 RepID=A0ACC2XHH0_9TREE|nr:hypothetical protein QFC22_001581 [Naganishia vaughanmartiniae]
MSDTEQQTKTTTEDVAMDDAPAATEQDAAPVADDAPAKDSAAMDTEEAAAPAAEEETNEKEEKSASTEKPVSSKPKGGPNKPSQTARKDGNSTRKLAGKIAKADAKESSKGKFQVGDVVLGKVVDRDDVPELVAKERPKSSSIVCVHSWLSPSDVKPLPKHEIDAYLKNTSRKTSGDLYQAYTIASHPKEWIAEREEERIAAKEESERKPTPADDEDELAGEEDEEEATAKSGGKRKRIAVEKKTTKEKPVSKRAKTDKAPPKKVSLTSARIYSRMSFVDPPERRMFADCWYSLSISVRISLCLPSSCLTHIQSAKKDAADEEAPASKKAANSKAAGNSKKAPASTGKKAAPTSAAKETKESKEAKDDAGDGMCRETQNSGLQFANRVFVSKSRSTIFLPFLLVNFDRRDVFRP